MTDRELLELAAKAARIEVLFDDDGDGYRVKASGNRAYWHPLDDDGDALRLAVRLNRTDIGALIMHYTTGAEYRDCPYAATRRAIVRAAAEIVKGMK